MYSIADLIQIANYKISVCMPISFDLGRPNSAQPLPHPGDEIRVFKGSAMHAPKPKGQSLRDPILVKTHT